MKYTSIYPNKKYKCSNCEFRGERLFFNLFLRCKIFPKAIIVSPNYGCCDNYKQE